jgi:hypothetical protein
LQLLIIIALENKVANYNDSQIVFDAPSEAVNTKTKFVEIGDRKIAYRSIGKGLHIYWLIVLEEL